MVLQPPALSCGTGAAQLQAHTAFSRPVSPVPGHGSLLVALSPCCCCQGGLILQKCSEISSVHFQFALGQKKMKQFAGAGGRLFFLESPAQAHHEIPEMTNLPQIRSDSIFPFPPFTLHTGQCSIHIKPQNSPPWRAPSSRCPGSCLVPVPSLCLGGSQVTPVPRQGQELLVSCL